MRTLNLKRKALVLSMALMAVAALALTQCKKVEPPTDDPTENPTDTVTNMPILPEGETVAITLKVNPDDNEKLSVNTGTGVVTFDDGDKIYVVNNGAIAGTLTYSNSESNFTGTISGDPANPPQPLYFYLLGNLPDGSISWTSSKDVSTGCYFDICDQTSIFPVISCAPSNEVYTGSEGVTEFTAILRNKCALAKFNTNVISGTVTLSNMYNKANVNFATNTITTDTEPPGNITFNTDAEGVGWAILLPHDEEITATASAAGYDPVNVTIPAINNNDYLNVGIAVGLVFNPLTTPLTFEAKTSGVVVTFDFSASDPVEYSTDGSTWVNYSSGTDITLANVGDKVMFRGTNATYDGSSFEFSWGGECYIYGNIMSLIDAANFATNKELTEEYTFSRLFYYASAALYNHPSKALVLPATTLTESCYEEMFSSCTNLTIAPELPAETLANYCYQYMFQGCTSLTTAPTLSATTLPNACYSHMFDGCTSLTTVPDLSATTLNTNCCSHMFDGCTSLTTAPALPAETLAGNCYEYMFQGCTSLTTAPALPATTLAESCCSHMFDGCTSLTIAPALPATTLAEICYEYMFNGCESLTSAPALPATTLAGGCYQHMFDGCESLTSAPSLPATTLAEYCYNAMFTGCTSLTTAPQLPAPTLKSSCYRSMFEGCSSLNNVTCLATTGINENYSTTYWMSGVAATGTFTKASGITWPTGNYGIPTGWTVIPVVPGKFSVSATKKVYFSQGNLVYSNGTWSFHTNQYDRCFTSYGFYNSTYVSTGTFDLFGWGTSGYNHGATSYRPYSTNPNYDRYYAYGDASKNLYEGKDEEPYMTGQADWGYNAISNGGNAVNLWRTLTGGEWYYVLFTRTTSSGILYAKAKVNGVQGVIVLPDNWSSSYYSLTNYNTASASYDSNTITLDDWNNHFQDNGAVFLPATGKRNGTEVTNTTGDSSPEGYYWSSTKINDYWSGCMWFDKNSLSSANSKNRNMGFAVRLVYDVP